MQQPARILRQLGANDALIKVNRVASHKLADIMESPMVQGMAKGTLTREEWDRKYIEGGCIIHIQIRARASQKIKKRDRRRWRKCHGIADMFLGYGKHFERLKKYGLFRGRHISQSGVRCPYSFVDWQQTSIKEFYISILTDMIPYVVFANYLLDSIEPSDNNPWLEYARKYGI